jgi:plastocyanin
MKRDSFCLLILFAYFLSGTALGQPIIKTSTVKGSITIGGKPTADAVVSVEGLPQEYLKSEISGLKSKKAVLNQRDMKFIPRVLAVVVGTTVDFPNNDTAWHNVFSKSEAKHSILVFTLLKKVGVLPSIKLVS